MAKSTIGFSIYLNGKLIDEIKVDRPVFNVGKLSTSTLRLDDVNVSRKHAVIELREDGKWRITDLGSTNGTILRGERIEQAELHDGDRLLIGRTTLVVHIEEAPSEQAAAAAAAYTAPATVSGTTGDPAPAAEEATAAINPGEVLAAPPRPAAAPAAPRPPRPVNRPLESWATSKPPAPTQARGFQLPRGTVGHIITLLGAALFLFGSLVLPWQRFELANLDLTAPEVSWLGLFGTIIGGSALVSSLWGMISGHRYLAARFNLTVGLVSVLWLVIALTQTDWGMHLMAFEQVSLQSGFLVATWGVLVMLGGAGVTFGSLPHWDESTSFLRLLVSRDNRPVRDVVVYEPGVVDLSEELRDTELGQDPALLGKLPKFRVTREGDTFMSVDPSAAKLLINNRDKSAKDLMSRAKRGPGGVPFAPVYHGDRGSVEVGDARVLFLFVKPIAGRGTVSLTSWTEGAAFGLLMVLLAIGLFIYSVIGWNEEGVREFRTDDRRMAKFELVLVEDKKPEEEIREVQVELPEPEVPEVESALVEDEKVGDEEQEDEQQVGEEEDMRDRTSELVDMLNPRNNEPIDLSKLSPTERVEKAREIAQQTALAQAFREDNPLYAQIMTINPDVDSRVNVLAALDGQGTTFIAGAVDPFGGTLSSGGGFPGGMDGGGLPTGGPNGGGPAIAGVFDTRGGPRNLDDVRFTERPLEPKIVEQAPRLSGELDAKTVQQYIRRYLSGIKWCYQDRLQSNRKLGGKLTLAFTILPNGNVMDARAANSTLGDAALEQCIAAKMSRWRFPSPKDGGVVDVAYPLILKTQ